MTQDQSARSILAAKLKEYRQKSGLTIYQVGEQIGKSGKTVGAWETGHGQPDAEMFIKLYYLYHMDSMSEFYGIADKDNPQDEVELLNAYRKLNDAGKATVLTTAKALVKSGDFAATDSGE